MAQNGNRSGRRGGYLRSTEPEARKILEQIEKTRPKRKVAPKKKTAKRKTKAKRRYA